MMPNGSSYKGTWKDDMKHGEGTETHQTGKTQEGTWFEGEL